MSDTVIRRIPLKEKSLVVDFLNRHWGEKHPLVNNDTLFNYYYADRDMTNFYVLEESGEIRAVCGYIKCSQREKSDIWISIWCAKKGKNGRGLQLMGEMKNLTGAQVMSCNNIRPATMPFYTFLGYFPGELEHHYRLDDRRRYKIARVKNKIIPKSLPAEGVSLKALDSIEKIKEVFSFSRRQKPSKDFWYIQKRYFDYPHYRYKVYGVFQGEKCAALAVFRVNRGREGNVLRLVDFLGNPRDFGLLSGKIDPLLSAFDCEYCDMYSRGVDGTAAGFVKRQGDENIIPNYLNPLLQKNIDYFYFTTDTRGFTMFKADGDQDRANISI